MSDKKSSTIRIILASSLLFFTMSLQAAETRFINDQKWKGPDIDVFVGLNGKYHFKSTKLVMLPNGEAKHRFTQYYLDIPVYGVSLAVTENRITHTFRNITGNYLKSIEPDLPSVQSRIAAQDAFLRVIQNAGANPTQIKNKQIEQFIYQDKFNKARLIYRISFVIEAANPIRPFFLLDAQTGEILDKWDGLTTRDATGPGGNEKTGRYQYGRDFGPLIVNDSCQMDTPTVVTIDMKHQTSGGSVHQFVCPENTYKFINGAYSPINDAHYFGHVIFDMYKQWFNSSPLRTKLRLRVHYRTNYENAFWDGQQMTFGDGATRFYPLVSLDVVSHEVSHGFTEQNSNLVYRNQPGGINEAFSDIAGEAAEYFMNSSKPTNERNDWLVGAQIIKRGTALRYFADPTRDGKSIGHASQYYDGLNVHYSSGVFNRAFYTLATKANWNTEKTFRTFVLANQVYWNQNTNFNEGGCGVMRAAKDLNFSTQDVIDAFNVVGVNASCGITPSTDELKNGVPVPNLSGNQGSEKHYYVNVPQGTNNLNITISGGTGDADLYVKFGAKPTTSTFDCRPYRNGNAEGCNFSSPRIGSYYVMVRGYTSYSGVTLVAKLY